MTDLQKLQEDIAILVQQINQKHKHERPDLISFMKVVEELGEITQVILSAEVNFRKGVKKEKSEIKNELGEEIADTLIALLSLANDFDIDVEPVVNRKMKKHFDRLKDF